MTSHTKASCRWNNYRADAVCINIGKHEKRALARRQPTNILPTKTIQLRNTFPSTRGFPLLDSRSHRVYQIVIRCVCSVWLVCCVASKQACLQANGTQFESFLLFCNRLQIKMTAKIVWYSQIEWTRMQTEDRKRDGKRLEGGGGVRKAEDWRYVCSLFHVYYINIDQSTAYWLRQW